MEEELNKLLKENLEISQESLKILKGIRRANRLSAAFKAFYWLVIIGATVGAYYYLQPYIKSAFDIFEQSQKIFSGSGLGNNGGTGTSQYNISPDALKNIPPDLIQNIQNYFKTK